MKTNQRQWLATGFFSFVRRCPVQRVSHTVLHWRHCSKPNGTYESSTRGCVCHTPSRKWLRAYVRTYVHAHTHTHTTTMAWKPMRPLLLFPSSHSPLLVPRHGSSYYSYYFIFPTPKAHTRIRTYVRTCTHCLCFARSHASATARLVSRRACALQARAHQGVNSFHVVPHLLLVNGDLNTLLHDLPDFLIIVEVDQGSRLFVV